MNADTGEVRKFKTLAEMNAAGIIPRLRSFKAEAKAKLQIRMYLPCECGSGKKYKFCCHVERRMTR